MKGPSVPVENATAELTQIIDEPLSLGLVQNQWITGGKCNMEYVNGVPMTSEGYDLKKDSPLQISGWSMDTENSRLSESIIIRFTDRKNTNFFAVAKTAFPRPDVRDFFLSKKR